MNAALFLVLLGAFATGDPTQTIAALEQRVTELCLAGRYQAAEHYQTEALRLWEQIAKTQSVDLAPAYANLAEILRAQGKLTAAARYAESARIWQEKSGANPLDRAQITGLLARIRFAEGRYAEALQFQRRVVSVLDTCPEPAAAELAKALNDLGVIQAALRDFGPARQSLERAVEMNRRLGVPSGEVLGNLALVCFRQGDFVAAGPLYQEAVRALEAAFGADHAYVGILLQEQADLLRKSGRKSEAKRISRRARAILESAPDLPGRNTIDVRSLRP